MANIIKIKTNGAMPTSAGTPLTLYTGKAVHSSSIDILCISYISSTAQSMSLIQ